MNELDREVEYLESQIPAVRRHPEDPRDRRVLKDRWWRRQTRWAEAARAMVILFVVWVILQGLGYRIVDRKDASLAATVTRLFPNAYDLADAELRHRLEGRAAAVNALERVLATELTPTGWISALFRTKPPAEAVRRQEVGKIVADRLAQIPLEDVGRTLDRLLALAHHMSEALTFEGLEGFSSLPLETKAALFNNRGESLSRIARVSGSYEQAAVQLKAIERLVTEEAMELAAKRSNLENQRFLLQEEHSRILSGTERYANARNQLNVCVGNIKKQYRIP